MYLHYPAADPVALLVLVGNPPSFQLDQPVEVPYSASLDVAETAAAWLTLLLGSLVHHATPAAAVETIGLHHLLVPTFAAVAAPSVPIRHYEVALHDPELHVVSADQTSVAPFHLSGTPRAPCIRR